jgi:hypothetical protein
MTVIAEKDRLTVRELLARELTEDVELVLFTRGRGTSPTAGDHQSSSSEETRELLGELAALSDRLHLTTYDLGADLTAASRYNVSTAPTVLIRRLDASSISLPGEDAKAPMGVPAATGAPDEMSRLADEPGANVRFLGLPGGYEFSTLIADIVDISKGQTAFSPETRAAIRAIDAPVHLQVFVTPT